MATYLDIMNSLKQDTEAAPVASVSLPDALGNPEVERFRSIQHKMQTVANASIKQEIERIVSLPIIGDPTEEEIELVSRWYCPSGSMKLFPEQVKAMMQYHDFGSIICPISVGGGKTLVSVLAANDGYTLFGKRKILLMTPSHLVNQLRQTELPKYRKIMSINVPFYWLAGESASRRMMMAKSNRAGCYVVSYSLLSTSSGAEIMDAIAPDLVIGDEIHRVASANPSARGRRFKEMIKKYSPAIVGLSGTITKKSPRDYHFLVVNALQERSFIPRPAMLNDEWSKILDTNASSIDQFQPNQAPQPGPIKIVVDWAKKNFHDEKYKNNLVGFRKSFYDRMRTTPGVIVSSGKDLVNSSLRFSNIKISAAEKKASQGWDKLQELVNTLVNEWVSPNGDEIEHAMHIWRYRYELEGIGAYNSLFWPDAEAIAKKRKVPESVAEDYLDRSLIHHKLQQAYNKELREFIKYKARQGLDTGFLIGQDMFRNGSDNVGHDLYSAWKEAREAKFPEIIEREEGFVRVCDFRIKKIIEWATRHQKENPGKGAVIWYDNIGVGLWLKDAFMQAGLPYFYCPANTQGRKNISDEANKGHFVLATFNAFSEGLNIQYNHSHCFYAQWPRSATIAEQSLGRLHRPGQLEDEVRVFISICSDFDKILLASCLNDSAYVHQTMGKQKLLYADWDERPSLVPYSVFVEWGSGALKLDEEGKRLLVEKFDGKEDIR